MREDFTKNIIHFRMLANNLHKRLYGTEFIPENHRKKEPIETVQERFPFLKPTKESTLEELRNNNALRIPKGAAQRILKHPKGKALILYLELKGLFISSIIFSDKSNLPYERVREFTGENLTTIRTRFRELKKLGLVRFDHKRNIKLESFRKFRDLLKLTCKKTHKLFNNGDTKKYIQILSIFENLERQKFVLKKKILHRELLEIDSSRQLDLNIRTSKCNYAKGCEPQRIESCKHDKSFMRKFKKHFNKSYDFYERKYIRVFNFQMQQVIDGKSDKKVFPEINPEVTLSCQGTARVCGLTSKASGHRIQRDLCASKLIKTVGSYIVIPERSSAIYEAETGLRNDVYGYKYPTRRNGMVKKYFRSCTNKIHLNMNSIIFQKPTQGA